jgi:hypothetical protein
MLLAGRAWARAGVGLLVVAQTISTRVLGGLVTTRCAGDREQRSTGCSRVDNYLLSSLQVRVGASTWVSVQPLGRR